MKYAIGTVIGTALLGLAKSSLLGSKSEKFIFIYSYVTEYELTARTKVFDNELDEDDLEDLMYSFADMLDNKCHELENLLKNASLFECSAFVNHASVNEYNEECNATIKIYLKGTEEQINKGIEIINLRFDDLFSIGKDRDENDYAIFIENVHSNKSLYNIESQFINNETIRTR